MEISGGTIFNIFNYLQKWLCLLLLLLFILTLLGQSLVSPSSAVLYIVWVFHDEQSKRNYPKVLRIKTFYITLHAKLRMVFYFFFKDTVWEIQDFVPRALICKSSQCMFSPSLLVGPNWANTN